MNNVLYQALPDTWHGFHINTGFHIGVQIALLMEDETLNERMRVTILMELLFADEDGVIREMPETMEEVEECLNWFMRGWNHDNDVESETHEKLMDFDVDQGRIYADFLHIYGIDLETTNLHWWKFNWLLWNMPTEQSSFLQVVNFRQEKPSKNASAEEKKAIIKRKQIYGLEAKKPKYSREDIKAIDEFDAFMAEINKKKEKD